MTARPTLDELATRALIIASDVMYMRQMPPMTYTDAAGVKRRIACDTPAERATHGEIEASGYPGGRVMVVSSHAEVEEIDCLVATLLLNGNTGQHAAGMRLLRWLTTRDSSNAALTDLGLGQS